MKIRLAALAILFSTTVYAQGPLVRFDISAQPLAGALQTLADQADLQILFTVADVQTHRAPPIAGRMSSEAALQKLLEGTSLEYVHNGDVVVVRERAVTRSATQGAEGQGSALRFAQTAAEEPRPTPPVSPTPSAQPVPARTAEPETLDTVVVTGTLIRGARVASPLIMLDREDIEATGYSTVQQVVQTLPQNFGGGDNEGTLFSPGGDGPNVARGAGINLRGLGSDSTLVLLNGHRLAPSAFGQFVDVSMIPLSAIRRIDVLTDGASATYGSDAVAGVVNFVLDDQFSGIEAQLKGGTVTEGHMDEYQGALSAGASGDRAHGLLTYEYFKRGNLDANDRDYARAALDPFDLLAETERHSVLASGAFDLSDRLALSATGLYSERDVFALAANTFLLVPTLQPSRSSFTSANATLALEISDSWITELTALFGRNDVSRDVIFPTFGLALAAERNRLDIRSGEWRADGPLFALPGGDAQLAVGASFREESFDGLAFGSLDPDSNRNAAAAYVELNLPLTDHLSISVAGRHEDYSDFGTTFDPKLGASWAPTDTLRLRGTYGTSFRAPQLFELSEWNVAPVLLNLDDPIASDGQTLTMLLTGNNASLTPEEATTWTAGIDLRALLSARTHVALTYFDIAFEDRIMEPVPNLELFTVFNQADLYASIITRDPDDAFIAELAANPLFQNGYGPFVAADVEAFLDRRLQNFSATDVNGVDLSVTHDLALAGHQLTFSLSGTYLLDYTEQLTPAAPAVDYLDTIYHLIDLKLRGAAHWQHDPWHTSLFLNYVDDYTNTTVTPAERVDAWMTVDLTLTYNAPWFAGARFTLSAINVFDEDPPFVASPIAQVAYGFDATNASALGRFVSLAVSQKW